MEAGALVRTDGWVGATRGPDDRRLGPVRECPYALGPTASERFGCLEIDLDALAAARRPMLRACTDSTEQRHHLAGGLGAAILTAMVQRGWVERHDGRRDLRVRHPEQIAAWLRR